MKVNKASSKKNQGMTLGLTLVTSAVLGLTLTSYLTMVSSQHRAISRSQTWNTAVPYAESGIEEALSHLDKNGIANMGADGWTRDGSTYTKRRNFTDGYFETTIGTGLCPVITSVGYAPVYGSDGYLSRTVRVTTTNSSMFARAMLAKQNISLNGNNITTDSFDSTDSRWSTNGQYDPSLAKSGGDVASTTGNLDIGNGDIYGNVSTSPTGTVTTGSNGSVGDATWHDGGNSGIQPGAHTTDLNVQIDDVQEPYQGGLIPLPQIIGGISYNYVLSGNKLTLPSLSGKILVTGNSTLYVTGNVNLTGTDFIKIAPGASLKLYVAGSSARLGGQGILNGAGNAANFQYYGLPSNTSVSFSGNGTFLGTVYAPSAVFTLNGGGHDSIDFIGASVTKSVVMNGNFNFHFDEALLKVGPSSGLVIVTWNEI